MVVLGSMHACMESVSPVGKGREGKGRRRVSCVQGQISGCPSLALAFLPQ